MMFRKLNRNRFASGNAAKHSWGLRSGRVDRKSKISGQSSDQYHGANRAWEKLDR